MSGALSFERGPGAVEEIAAKLSDWLTRPAQEQAAARRALSEEARRRYGWEGVARGVIAAAAGELQDLQTP